MVQKLFDQNIIGYVYAGLCGLGLLIRFILDMVFRKIVKQSDNLGTTKNKALRLIRMKFETCYKLKIGVNNVDIFVDKSISKYRFGGLLLSTWEGISGQVLLMILLIIPVSSVFGVLYEVGREKVLFTGAVGIFAGALLILVDRLINLGLKKQYIRLNILDYLVNYCRARLEQEEANPDMLEQYRREYFMALNADRQATAAAVQAKEETKKEISRRKEARLRKEEEKRVRALEREEEQKRIEKARKEEELRKLEERKKMAAKRRQEELLRLEEEREALEKRRAELKKRAEERLQRQRTKEDKLLSSIEEELIAGRAADNTKSLTEQLEEIAADISSENDNWNQEAIKQYTPEEEKLIEDVLKAFFA